YVWLDSQDLGGIEKEVLRHVPVWVLGVQREANEIKRTLANIPASVAKPSASDIATLELGQFYACWGRHAIKTYVQPLWLDAAIAQRVAMGEQAASVAPPPPPEKETAVTSTEADRLNEENTQLRAENADLRR